MYIGTREGKLFKVENADTTPTYSEVNTPIVGSISSISFGQSEQELLVTVSNFKVNNVWYSPDGGTTWEEKDANLPDMPVRDALFDPADPNNLILATEAGVWGTSNFLDATPTWSTSNNGLSNVRVTQFDYRASDGTVSAATYGRGAFTAARGFLGLHDAKTSSSAAFEVYPQPAHDQIFLKFEENQAYDVVIYNVTGQKVRSQKGVKNNESIQLGLASGLYVVEAVSQNGDKFTKEILVK